MSQSCACIKRSESLCLRMGEGWPPLFASDCLRTHVRMHMKMHMNMCMNGSAMNVHEQSE